MPPCRFVGDLSLKTVHNFIGGRKEKDTDSINVNYGRDFECQFFGDIAEVEAGFTCPKCQNKKLTLVKAVEFGNIFNIGHTYSEPMKGEFIDQNNQPKKLYMGSYGIGIGRAMATVIEIHHDDKGMLWPSSIAPFTIHLITLDCSDANIKSTADSLYQQLVSSGFDTLHDDRENATAGEKFADSDLIGCPIRLVVSKRSLQTNSVEVKLRSGKESRLVNLKDTIQSLKDLNT